MNAVRRDVETHAQFHSLCVLGVISACLTVAFYLAFREYRAHSHDGPEIFLPLIAPALASATAFALAWRTHRFGRQSPWIRRVPLTLLIGFFVFPLALAFMR
ncbi:hypothetical protein [Arenimonas sp.]|uniref:hypothetical protein n=1 Tax=Arenimonas sp. TaxID=1872635 RepID=UPI0039E49DA6